MRDTEATVGKRSRNVWIPVVSHYGGFGCWAFIEITDPWDAERTIRAFLGAGRDAEAA